MLAGQKLGIKEVDDGIWLVSFMRHDLGYFDLEQKPCNPRQPVRLTVVTHVSGGVTYMSGMDPGAPDTIRTCDLCLRRTQDVGIAERFQC
jgi:hypothetical protein